MDEKKVKAGPERKRVFIREPRDLEISVPKSFLCKGFVSPFDLSVAVRLFDAETGGNPTSDATVATLDSTTGTWSAGQFFLNAVPIATGTHFIRAAGSDSGGVVSTHVIEITAL